MLNISLINSGSNAPSRGAAPDNHLSTKRTLPDHSGSFDMTLMDDVARQVNDIIKRRPDAVRHGIK